MANRNFFYFFAPTWDFPPDGPIKLGNVITSVKKPEHALACRPPPEGSDTFKTVKKNLRYTKGKERNAKFSVLTKFLSVLGFGVDVGAEIDKSTEEIFLFETLETTQFSPTPSYLQTCIEAEHVRRYLQTSRFQKPIYIITGLKVAIGANASTNKSRVVGGTLAAEVDGTVWSSGAVPIGGGPGIEGKVGSKSGTEWSGSDDFVFAFRVSKVFASKREVRADDYVSGAMFRTNTPGPGRSARSEMEILRVEDPDAELEGFQLEDLVEDTDAVPFAVPTE